MPDILVSDAPALSATSDMPEIAAAEPTPTPDAPETPDAVEAAAEAADEGEAPEAVEAAPEGEEASGGPETPPQPRKRDARQTVQERMNELTALRRAADERADRAIAALEAYAKTVPPPAAEAKPAPLPAPEPRPARDDFADPDTYDTALIEWSARQTARITAAAVEEREATRRAAEEKTRSDTAMMEEGQRLAATWQERRAKTIEAHPDFESVAENPDLQIPMAMVPTLLEIENGPDVLYHLGSNPDEAVRIAKLSERQQVIELGRISERITQSRKPQVTRAPKPITPVGSNNGAGPKDPSDMTTEEYAAYRMPKLNADRKASMYGQRH
jgi:hypothetical protein